MMIVLLLIGCFCFQCDAAESELFEEDKSRIESGVDDHTKGELERFGISGIDDVVTDGIDSGSVWHYLSELIAAYSHGPLAALILLTAVLLLASVAESYTFSLRYTETRDIMGVVVSLFISSILINPVTQLMYGNWKFETLDENDHVIETRVRQLTMRQTNRQEFRWLAELCGFKVIGLYKDYRWTPADETASPLIWILKKE